MAQITHWRELYKCDLTGYTIVIPSVGIGNVAQLACDLVVSSIAMKKMALVYSRALIPVAGSDPYSEGTKDIIACSALYVCESKKFAILLLRAPPVQKYSAQFLTDVVDKFKADNIKDIIVLTSSYAHEKRHIMTSPFRFLVNEFFSEKQKYLDLEWVEHEPYEEPFWIAGGGYSSELYSIINEKSVPCLFLYKFSSEGNNIPDAHEMVLYLNSIVGLYEEKDIYPKLVSPPSWRLMYGRPAPMDMF